MTRRLNVFTVALCLTGLVSARPAVAASGDVNDLLRAIPADFAFAAVVPNFAELDKSISAMRKRINPGDDEEGMLAQLKDEWQIAAWVDFSKPMALAAPSLGGTDWDGAMWVTVPDFASKVKTLEGASETGGIWTLPFEEGHTEYAKVRGGFVVAALTKDALVAALAEGKSLAEEMKSRTKLLSGRDALIHLNIDPVRDNALAGIAQAAQMAPMLAMMMGQQAGMDPAMMTAGITSLVGAVKGFIEQIAYVEVFVGIGAEEANVTIATGYNDGPIKSYLAVQKPASVTPFEGMGYQPFFAAFAFHMPGGDSPFYDYVFDEISSAINSAPGAAPAQPGEAKEPDDSLEKGLKAAFDMYRAIEGTSMVMAMPKSGMTMSGDIIAKDNEAFVAMFKDNLVGPNSLGQQLETGVSYEALESKKIGGVTVDQFRMKIDSSNPQAAMAKTMYGEDPRFTIGVVDGRFRYFMGPDAQAERMFGSKVSKPFSKNSLVANALAKLPKERNSVMLLDLAAMIPMLGPLMGNANAEPVPPGPPIALSVSFVGDPARVDIHIPFRAIERVMQATGGGADDPM